MDKLNDTTFKIDKVKDEKRKIEIEIGDAKQPIFYPQVKTKHWDNEANFSIRLKEDIYDGEVSQKGKTIEYKKGIKIARMYELDPDHVNEDGGFEFEVEFAEKPESNVLEFSLKTKGFKFIYQPEITDEQAEQLRRQWVDDNLSLEQLKRRHQPDNVVGSYAVYHESKKNNQYQLVDNISPEDLSRGISDGSIKQENGKNYVLIQDIKTGKAFHVYRPFVLDNNGVKSWCELEIDIKEETLRVIIPQNFLDKASYPIIIDPTFGYTSIGSTLGFTSANSLFASAYQTSVSTYGTIDKISVYAGHESFQSAINIKGVSLDSLLKILTNGISSSVAIPASTAPQWYDLNYSTKPYVSSNDDYPTVQSSALGRTTASDTTSHVITMPSGVQAGDLLLVFFTCDQTPTFTVPSDWNVSPAGNTVTQDPNATIKVGIFWKIAEGSDSLTITTSNGQQSSHIVYRISNGGFPADIGGSGVTTTNGNPPSLNLPFSTKRLWFASLHTDSTVVASGAPSGYSSLQTQAAAGTSGASTSVARKTAETDIEDPGTFTNSSIRHIPRTLALANSGNFLPAIISDTSEIWLYYDFNSDSFATLINTGNSYASPTNMKPTNSQSNIYSIYSTFNLNGQANSPSTIISDSSNSGDVSWSNPSNAGSSDNTYANAGSGLNATLYDEEVKIVKSDGTIGSTNKASASAWSNSDAYTTYGGPYDLWGETWTYADINDSDFGVVISANDGFTNSEYLKATNFGFSIPSGATIDGIQVDIEKQRGQLAPENYSFYIDHIRITVYYTESSGTEANANRDAETHGKASVNDSRDTETTGTQATNDTREAELHGIESLSSSRDIEASGQETANNSRDSEVVGVLGSNTSRNSETTGELSDFNARDSETTGVDTVNADRDSELRGVLSDTSNRGSEATGGVAPVLTVAQDGVNIKLTWTY